MLDQASLVSAVLPFGMSTALCGAILCAVRCSSTPGLYPREDFSTLLPTHTPSTKTNLQIAPNVPSEAKSAPVENQ